MSQNATPLKGADVGIPPRQLDFRISPELPKYAYAGNATVSCFWAMISAFFPPVENFIVQSAARYRHLVTDPELRARVAGFTGQEMIHTREHERLNEVFTSRGFDLRIPDTAARAALSVLRRLPASTQLACTIAIEHFTALLAEEMLGEDDFRSNIHPDAAGIWLWHSLEEAEHKSVTFEVYEIVGNSHPERVVAATVCLAIVAPATVIGWLGLLVQQRVWTIPGDVRTGAELLFGKGRFLPRVVRQIPLCFRRSFRPDGRDSRALQAEWRTKLFGAEGSLTDQLRYPLKPA